MRLDLSIIGEIDKNEGYEEAGLKIISNILTYIEQQTFVGQRVRRIRISQLKDSIQHIQSLDITNFRKKINLFLWHLRGAGRISKEFLESVSIKKGYGQEKICLLKIDGEDKYYVLQGNHRLASLLLLYDMGWLEDIEIEVVVFKGGRDIKEALREVMQIYTMIGRAPGRTNFSELKTSAVIAKNSIINTEELAEEFGHSMLPKFIISDGELSLLFENCDKPGRFKIYYRVDKVAEWERVKPISLKRIPEDWAYYRDYDVNLIVEPKGEDLLVFRQLDLGESPPHGAARLIFKWKAYAARQQNRKVQILRTRNPKILTLLSEISDFKFDVDFLHGKSFFVGKKDTPVEIRYKFEDFRWSLPDEYEINIHGQYSLWEAVNDTEGNFTGWQTPRGFISKDERLSLGEKGVIYRGKKAIGQILSFRHPLTIHAAPYDIKEPFYLELYYNSAISSYARPSQL